MNAFETSATVEAQGEVRVAGVPFAAGTEVEVTIRPARIGGHAAAPPADAGLGWEGNVLVHQGVGATPSVAELRDDHLNRLAEGRSG